MPTIIDSNDLPVSAKNGVQTATLANPTMLGTNALQVERIEVQAGGKTSMFEASDSERFIYVIRGKGLAQVGEQAFPLEDESVLWLDKEDAFHLEASAEGLELLLCHASARE